MFRLLLGATCSALLASAYTTACTIPIDGSGSSHIPCIPIAPIAARQSSAHSSPPPSSRPCRDSYDNHAMVFSSENNHRSHYGAWKTATTDIAVYRHRNRWNRMGGEILDDRQNCLCVVLDWSMFNLLAVSKISSIFITFFP